MKSHAKYADGKNDGRRKWRTTVHSEGKGKKGHSSELFGLRFSINKNDDKRS